MKTAVVYTRVSSEEQVSGTSLDTQKRDCIAAAKARGYTVARVFTDAGFSAKTADRPDLTAAVDYCRQNKPDAFFVWKLDRLSRNTADGLIIRSQLARLGTELISATESFTNDPTGDLVSTLLLGVAQFDNAQRSLRCRRGMVETALRGGWTHKAPVGFENVKNADGLPVLRISDPQGVALQGILKDYAAGTITKAEYFAKTAAIGISTQTADKIPTREIYAGIIREKITGGQPVRAAFPGMITPEELEAIRAQRKQRAPRAPGTTVADIWRETVRCAACGHHLTPYEQKGNIYWKCQHCRLNIRDRILYEKLNAVVCAAPEIAQLLKAIASVARIIARDRIAAQRTQREAAAAEAAAARRKLDRLVDLLLDNRIDQESYDRKAAELQTIIARAKDSETDATFDINAAISNMEQTVEILSDPRRFLLTLRPDRARAVLRLIFGEFVIDPKTRSVVVPSSSDALYGLLQKTKTAAELTTTEDSESSISLSWWTNVRQNLTRIGEKCREIAAAV